MQRLMTIYYLKGGESVEVSQYCTYQYSVAVRTPIVTRHFDSLETLELCFPTGARLVAGTVLMNTVGWFETL